MLAEKFGNTSRLEMPLAKANFGVRVGFRGVVTGESEIRGLVAGVLVDGDSATRRLMSLDAGCPDGQIVARLVPRPPGRYRLPPRGLAPGGIRMPVAWPATVPGALLTTSSTLARWREKAGMTQPPQEHLKPFQS